MSESTPRTALVTQSNYIPWKGYFHAIELADVFVAYDDVQYTRRDWRNRNQIKTKDGLKWLTIPVSVKRNFTQTIRDTQVSDPGWAATHWRTLQFAYGKAPCFPALRAQLETLYEELGTMTHLSQVNWHSLQRICEWLDITTEFRSSSEFACEGNATERLVQVCQAVGATRYLTGPAAKSYLDTSLFERAGIDVRWMDYTRYRSYPQIHGEFTHAVSILDLLLNVGPEAREYVTRLD